MVSLEIYPYIFCIYLFFSFYFCLKISSNHIFLIFVFHSYILIYYVLIYFSLKQISPLSISIIKIFNLIIRFGRFSSYPYFCIILYSGYQSMSLSLEKAIENHIGNDFGTHAATHLGFRPHWKLCGK